MKLRLALCAISFGFGPSSKAAMIARQLSRHMEIEWAVIGDGLSAEYLKREGFSNIVSEHDADLANFDAALVVMDNQRANDLADKMPVFFVDSLGYMWSEKDFHDFPKLKMVEAYFVQDMFGSYENMQKTNVKNIVRTPPIVEKARFEVVHGAYDVVHLGGLLNPINKKTSAVYLSGIINIFSSLNLEQPVYLASESAVNIYRDIVEMYNFKSLPHAQTLQTFAASRMVISSPGLTTMLEIASLNKPYLPLPPQNYSQVLNMQNVYHAYTDSLHPVWQFLSERYGKINSSLPEEEGVKLTTQLNQENFSSTGFISTYKELLADAIKARPLLPLKILNKENGIEFVSRAIMDAMKNIKLNDRKPVSQF